MAQDYDSPRNKDDDDSLEELGKGTRPSAADLEEDADANAVASSCDVYSGADVNSEDSSITVTPTQSDEFLCYGCFLIKHRSQLARTDATGHDYCKECVDGDGGYVL